MVSISNISTSIFAGFVIFSIVGYLAKELDKEVSEVLDQGINNILFWPQAIPV